jgi:hypothetical protein
MGSANCDYGDLAKTIRRIADDPQARWLGMGDMVESIAPDDPRWNPADVTLDLDGLTRAEREEEKYHWLRRTGDWYVAKLAQTIAPIIDKCWGMNDGNHEDKFGAKYHTNLTLRVLEKLGKTDALGRDSHLYGEWASITRVVFEDDNQHRRQLRVFQQHGWQAGRKDGAAINGLDDLMGWCEACHIYLVAHSHKRLMKTFTKLDTNPKFTALKAYDAFGAHTGSFLKTYQQDKVGYGERKGYRPNSFGPIEFRITPTKEGLKVRGIQ